MRYKDKYNLNVYENTMVAKRNIIGLIYNSAKLEGLAVTFIQTQTIYDNRTVDGMTIFDTNVIVNLKRAYQYILDRDVLKYPVDVALTTNLNRLLGKVRGDDDLWLYPGELRNGEVRITGTNWIPPLPNYNNIRADLNELSNNSKKSYTERGFDLALYVCKQQPFWDGNKRTGIVLANQYLISNGAGILSIPEARDSEFRKLLVDYYETDDTQKVKDFMYEFCLEGMAIDNSSDGKKENDYME